MWLEADSWSFEGLFTAFSFGCGGGNLDQKENLDSDSYIIIRVLTSMRQDMLCITYFLLE